MVNANNKQSNGLIFECLWSGEKVQFNWIGFIESCCAGFGDLKR